MILLLFPQVGNVGEGVLEGGKALAKGVLAGAVGVLARPLEGAERGGLTGFLGGVAKVRDSIRAYSVAWVSFPELSVGESVLAWLAAVYIGMDREV
jgi:hypothetical protein